MLVYDFKYFEGRFFLHLRCAVAAQHLPPVQGQEKRLCFYTPPCFFYPWELGEGEGGRLGNGRRLSFPVSRPHSFIGGESAEEGSERRLGDVAGI